MGSDDIFKKRKKRKQLDLSRKEKERNLYKNVQIICEGETELYYLKGLIKHLNLNSKRIKVRKSQGTDPVTIVNEALDNVPKFDYTYCIYDGTGNTNLQDATNQLNEYKKKNKKNPIFSIVSYPCFEYWILMHYSNTTKPFNDTEYVRKELKKHLPSYQKAMKNLFETTEDKTDQAIENSQKTYNQSISRENPNPSTQMHIVIKHLIQISDEERQRQ